jgi:hypothetical protein
MAAGLQVCVPGKRPRWVGGALHDLEENWMSLDLSLALEPTLSPKRATVD